MSATSRPPAVATSLIDLQNDRLIPVQELCEARLGKRVSPPTLFRWIQRGNRAGKLEAVWIAGRWCTTEIAFADYMRRTTAAKLTSPAPADDADADDPPAERPPEVSRALRRRGIKVDDAEEPPAPNRRKRRADDADVPSYS